MSEVEFTPGPWVVDSDIGKKGRVGISSSRWAYLAKVVVKMKGLDNISAEGNANAHLVAAAPELYEALSEVLCTFQNFNPQESPNEYVSLMLKVEYTLAKARGETP